MTATITIRGHVTGEPWRGAQTEYGNTYTHAKVRGDHEGHTFDWPLITGDESLFASFRAGDHIEVSGRLKARRMGADSRDGAVLPFLNDPRCYFLVIVERVSYSVGRAEALAQPVEKSVVAKTAAKPRGRPPGSRNGSAAKKLAANEREPSVET